MNALRAALLDAIDARDESVKTVADAGMRHAVRARSAVVVAAAMPDATEETVTQAVQHPELRRRVTEAVLHAAMVARAHAREHVPRVMAAGPGPDEGPVRRSHLEARRRERTGVVK